MNFLTPDPNDKYHRKFSLKHIGIIILAINLSLIVMHILIMLSILPPDIVWGGSATGIMNSAYFIGMEILAITFIVLFSIPVMAKINLFAKKLYYVRSRFVNYWLYFICFYYLLNTIGNIASSSDTESMVFTPLTIILSILHLVFGKAKTVKDVEREVATSTSESLKD